MIVSIRGTSGAGKTVLARALLHDETGQFRQARPVYAEGRRRPMYYLRDRVDLDVGLKGLAILGSYESPTGGCDTISGNDIPFDLCRQLGGDYHVFFEGLLMSAEQHRTARLHEDGHDVRLFYLDTSLDTCLDSVRQRRADRGNDSPLNPKTTSSRHRAIRTHPDRFRGKGLNVAVGSRDAALQWLKDMSLVGPKCLLELYTQHRGIGL